MGYRPRLHGGRLFAGTTGVGLYAGITGEILRCAGDDMWEGAAIGIVMGLRRSCRGMNMDAVWAGGWFSNRPYGRWRLGMSERIYIRNERGRLEPLDEEPFRLRRSFSR